MDITTIPWVTALAVTQCEPLEAFSPANSNIKPPDPNIHDKILSRAAYCVIYAFI